MQLIERNDPGFGTAVLYRCADTWRLRVNRASDRALNTNCFVIADDNGYKATVAAFSEADLSAFVEKEFWHFKITPVKVEDGMFTVQVEPRILSWKPLRTF